ncbi:uncharacterized protein LOC117194153 [Drosophila miranda]|uniref:uncharacterized protein LOC117194153 n=1 Tax=Drosophila miranda TaxID=7229 RepID=UPI00143F4727|nr:uncharacterized protein LOC117194153 [Drosophila miranda]
MSDPQPKDTALKTKDTAVATPAAAAAAATGLATLPPPQTATATKTTTALTGRKTLTSSRAFSLFDQMKNGVNLNSLTIGATATAAATEQAATSTATGSTPTSTALPALAPPPVPPVQHSNIELKPPAKPPRLFSMPSSIGIVQGTKRGANDDGTGTASAAQSPAALDINALRSQLYQGAAAPPGGAAGGAKMRCRDRYDSSESSDR